jgi:transcription initiation factor TFIIIB Brf1 subunit/transcription initiation factor TFIIB
MESKKKETVKICPDCGSDKLYWREGERYCKNCGLVID